ncbi:MAG: ATPase domain-containing protein [Candidatus Woesearchaeota archaeon]
MQNLVNSIAIPRDELNRNIGGGIPQGSIMLIEGKDGAGKSIIAQRIAYGLTQNNTSCSYISTELNLIEFIQQMNSLNYRITEKIIAEDLLFISLFPQMGNVKLKETFMNDLLSNKKLFSTEVIIFDTISYLLVSTQTSEKDIFNLVSFIKKIAGLNKTILCCIDPDMCNIKFLNMIRNIPDIYLQTEAKMVLGNLLRVISVIRYKKSIKEVASATPYKVIPGAGFAIELASLA